MTATAVGQTTLVATLGLNARVDRAGVGAVRHHLLRGKSTPVFPTLDARVEVLDGPFRGMSASADATGLYRLFGVAGALQLLATMAGHLPETRALTVNAPRRSATSRLAPTVGTTLLGSWTLAVTASTSCPTMRAISPLTAPVFVEQDASRHPVVLVGDTGEGPWHFPATIQGTILNVVLSMSLRDEPDGPGLFVRSVDGRTAQIFGYLTAGTTSPTTLADSLAACNLRHVHVPAAIVPGRARRRDAQTMNPTKPDGTATNLMKPVKTRHNLTEPDDRPVRGRQRWDGSVVS